MQSDKIISPETSIDIYADCGSFEQIIQAAKDPNISGITTNPTLIKQQGVSNYTDFAENVIRYLSRRAKNKTFSIEVVCDDYANFPGRTTRYISQIAHNNGFKENLYFKVPFFLDCGKGYTESVIGTDLGLNTLGKDNINFTAVFSINQVHRIVHAIAHFERMKTNNDRKFIISIFSGRIADCGYDPEQLFQEARQHIKECKLKTEIKLLWASTREPFNYYQAKRCRADIITMAPDIYKKLNASRQKQDDMYRYSFETCEMFYEDIIKASFDSDDYKA